MAPLYRDRGSHFLLTPKAGEPVDKQRLTQVGRAMKELGIQMLPAYSPPARGRSERNFGAWQGGRPQALRLADLGTLEAANPFLGERYMAEFNRKFTVPTKERGTAFRKTGRVDLDWIFSTQSERVVARDNPLAFPDQTWQWEKTRWRYSVAGCAVTVHEHLDGRISGRYGPQVVAGWQASGGTEQPKPRGGKGGVVENQTAVPPSLGISATARDSHFPAAPTATAPVQKKGKPKPLDRTDRV